MKLKIISDGTPHGTKIMDEATGNLLAGVVRIVIPPITANGGLLEAQVTVRPVTLDLRVKGKLDLEEEDICRMVRAYHGWATDQEMIDAVGYDAELYVAKMRLAVAALAPMSSGAVDVSAVAGEPDKRRGDK